MILITKNEKDLIVDKFPKAHIVRTCKQKSNRHKYYLVEDRKVMRYLNALRHPNKVGRRRYNDRQRPA